VTNLDQDIPDAAVSMILQGASLSHHQVGKFHQAQGAVYCDMILQFL